MRVTIEDAPSKEAEEIIIRCKSLTARQLRAVEILRSQRTIVGYLDTAAFQLAVEDIYYVEAVERKTFAYGESETYEIKQRLYEFEDDMDDSFVRVSKSMILNWVKVASLRPLMNGRLEALLENGEKVTVSRQYVQDLKTKFGIGL